MRSTSHTYALQELLKFCGFASQIGKTTASLRDKKSNSLIATRWAAFDDANRSLLAPYLQTRYSTHAILPKKTDTSFFKSENGFSSWIQEWTIALIEATERTAARSVLLPCKILIRGGDTDTAVWLLPHLILEIWTHAKEQSQVDVLNEMTAVLEGCGEQKNAQSMQCGEVSGSFLPIRVPSLFDTLN